MTVIRAASKLLVTSDPDRFDAFVRLLRAHVRREGCETTIVYEYFRSATDPLICVAHESYRRLAAFNRQTSGIEDPAGRHVDTMEILQIDVCGALDRATLAQFRHRYGERVSFHGDAVEMSALAPAPPATSKEVIS